MNMNMNPKTYNMTPFWSYILARYMLTSRRSEAPKVTYSELRTPRFNKISLNSITPTITIRTTKPKVWIGSPKATMAIIIGTQRMVIIKRVMNIVAPRSLNHYPNHRNDALGSGSQ